MDHLPLTTINDSQLNSFNAPTVSPTKKECFVALKDFFYDEYVIPLQKHSPIHLNTLEEGFYFIYCWEGNMKISIKNDKKQKLEALKSALIYNKEPRPIHLFFKKNNTCRFCVIGFRKPSTLFSNCYYTYKQEFFTYVPLNTQMFVGKPYLKLLEKINDISNTVKRNVTTDLILEGLIYQILGLKLEQLKESDKEQNNNYCPLTSYEIERLQMVANKITENPSLEYTIEFLCVQTGLSPFKLQEGFKTLYKRTAIDFIRNVRLEKSAELLESTDLNISEIVYSIGFTSRSYFSKIFKKKYKCSPKIFQKQKMINKLAF